MGLLQKLGGRKWLMALVAIAAAMILEAKTDRGLTPTMAGFLAGIVGLFSASNYLTTASHLKSESAPDNSDQDQVLLEVHNMLSKGAASPENLNSLLGVLGTIKSDLDEVKKTAGQTGKGVVSLLQRRN